MHAILFNLKRAHLSALRTVRGCANSFGLTPARFDMLFVIHKSLGSELFQGTLRRVLGVAASTVSRMVDSLVRLGHLTRERSSVDRRRVLLRLTGGASRLLRAAIARVIGSGSVAFALESALTDHFYSETACFLAMDRLDSSLIALRRGLRDSATQPYIWHPDD